MHSFPFLDYVNFFVVASLSVDRVSDSTVHSFNTMAASTGSGFSVWEIIFLNFSAMMECHADSASK